MFNQKNKVTRADYEQWRAGQDETAARIASDPDRLLFHVEPELGWLNDPNGLVQIGDTYHIYHQYDPFDAAHGGPVLWNHLTTKDFVTYENHGPVLFPDSDLDSSGAYSGSAFVRDGKIHYFYTGNVKHFDRDDYDYVLTGREQNQIHVVAENPDELGEKCIAVGPVDYPDDIGTHVRDPKILEHDGIYYMVLGARTKDDRGCVLVYTSRNLEDWSYATRIELGEKFGFMWECPDLFELDGELILVCCPQGVSADGWRYRNPHQCVWFPIEADWGAPSFKIAGQGVCATGGETVEEPGRLFDLVVSCEGAKMAELEIRKGVFVRYADGMLTLDMGDEGYGRDQRSIELSELRDLRVLSDTTMVEIFANGGEAALTSRTYSPAVPAMELHAEGAASMNFYRLVH